MKLFVLHSKGNESLNVFNKKLNGEGLNLQRYEVVLKCYTDINKIKHKVAVQNYTRKGNIICWYEEKTLHSSLPDMIFSVMLSILHSLIYISIVFL